MREIKITTPFIRLDSFLKLAGMVGTGGHAKIVITEGEVTVNGQICLMRGKKLYGGEEIEYDGQRAVVAKGE